MKKNVILKIISLFFALLLLFCFDNETSISAASESKTNDKLIVKFFEIGNADCTFIKQGDIDILIDIGENSRNFDSMKNYLQKNITDGVLDYLFITHGDNDHIGTTKEFFPLFNPTSDNVLKTTTDKKFIIDTVIDFDTNYAKDQYTSGIYKTYVETRNQLINQKQKGIKNYYSIDEAYNKFINHKVTFTNSDLSIHLLNNKYYFEKPINANLFSVCLLFEFGEAKVLMTGDLEENNYDFSKIYGGESALVENNGDIIKDVTLFKAGHHGSNTSNSKTLLDVINPDYIVISCSASNPKHNFPKKKALDNMLEYTENIYITSKYSVGMDTAYYGEIEFAITKEEKVEVNCSNAQEKKDGILKRLKETEWYKENWSLKIRTFDGYISEDDVELGNCVLIEYDYIDILVDCGNHGIFDNQLDMMSSTFLDKIQKHIIDDKIEYLIVTSQWDYSISQLVDITNNNNYVRKGVLSKYKIDNIIDCDFFDVSDRNSNSLYARYNEKKQELKNSGTKLNNASKANYEKMEFNFGDQFEIEILKNEYYGCVIGENKYDSVVGFTINYYGKRMLFLGDMSFEGEKSIIDNNDLNNIVYFQPLSFGSPDSCGKELLNKIKENSENLVIVSNSIAGKNYYGSVLFNRCISDRLINTSSRTYVTTYIDNKGDYQKLNSDIVYSILYENSNFNYDVKCSNNNGVCTKLRDSSYYK